MKLEFLSNLVTIFYFRLASKFIRFVAHLSRPPAFLLNWLSAAHQASSGWGWDFSPLHLSLLSRLCSPKAQLSAVLAEAFATEPHKYISIITSSKRATGIVPIFSKRKTLVIPSFLKSRYIVCAWLRILTFRAIVVEADFSRSSNWLKMWKFC